MIATIMKSELVQETKGQLTVDRVLLDSTSLTYSDRLRLAVLKVRSGIVAVK